MFRGAWASILVLVGCGVPLAGCGSSSTNEPGCPEGKKCSSATPEGTIHPLRADGTVDITPSEAWPKRANETAPLSANELGAACAILATCSQLDLDPEDDEDQVRAVLQQACLGPHFWEERAVPTLGKNERWTYEARALIAAGGGCNALQNSFTERAKEIVCEEVGCWWQSTEKPIPTVTCAGDIATLVTEGTDITRDCSHALADCDPESATGCSDRAPTGCEHPAKDRCDGDVRLGCDGTGRVSFHDCSRVSGGQCVDTPNEGPECVYPADPNACAGAQLGCDTEGKLTLCVLESPAVIDCKSLGFLGCEAGYCSR
jgi:hypothetical protein